VSGAKAANRTGNMLTDLTPRVNVFLNIETGFGNFYSPMDTGRRIGLE